MSAFKVGDHVVYPMYGAGTVESIEHEEVRGEMVDFYVILLEIGNMRVHIPVHKASEVGIRAVIDAQEIDRIFEILRQSMSKMPGNWNRRYRENLALIKTGNIFDIAGVVRNLRLLELQKGLSSVERRMLTSASQMLVSELELATDDSTEELERKIYQEIDRSF